MGTVNASVADVDTHDLSGSENDDELMDEGEDLPGNRLYPSDAHLLLANKVLHLKASNHAVFSLVPCLQAVHSILCHHQHGSRMRQADLDSIRRFFRDDLLHSVDKMLQFPNSIKVAGNRSLEDGVMEALQWAACVAAGALRYRAELDPADVVSDLDADFVPVAQSMLQLFNQHKNLHQQVADFDLPQILDFFHGHVESEYARPIRDELDDLGVDDPDAPVVERHRWLAALINTFAGFHGFNAIVKLLQHPGGVSFPLLNMMAAVLAQVIDHISEEAHDLHQQVVGPVLNHVTELVEVDNDRLHDYGQDRTYSVFQCLVNINMPRIMRYSSERRQQNFAQLRRIQCTFVLKMLESSTFNKLLSGVRECNKLLKEAATLKRSDKEQFRALIRWFEEHDIVQRILRTNLHQKQYVQEVQGIMITLTQSQCVTADHLDMLWAVIEKEDTYDAVKTHMFELLGELAVRFVPSQLDMLFNKLQRHQDCSVQDTKRLLTLLQHLADSDSELIMEEKIIQMVWDITIPATADRELQEVKTLSNIISSYAGPGKDGHELIKEYLDKCFSALVKGQGGQVALLRCFRELLKLLPSESHRKDVPGLQEQVVDHMVDKGLLIKLVDALCKRVAAAHKAIAAAKAEQVTSKAAAVIPVDAAAAVTEAAVATLSEGGWAYTEIIREYMLTLKTIASMSTIYFDGKLAEKLWDTLMVNPAYHEDQLPATQLFFRVGFQGDKQFGSIPTFEPSTQQVLLEKHMVLQDASRVVSAAAKLFLDIFTKVNLENNVVKWFCHQGDESHPKQAKWLLADQLQGVKGLDFIWSMYLHNPDRRIAQLTKEQLLQLYHAHMDAQESAPYRKALVQRLVSSLQKAATGLSVKPTESTAAALAVSRCLSLALSAVAARQSKTMPAVPAHHLGWRGTPLQLEVQQPSTNRLRVTSHSNEYVGLLRERIARQLGCGANQVRIVLLGQEWKFDSYTLPPEAKNRTVLTGLVSPEPNSYTQSPAEYKPYYEAMAFAWLFSQADGLYPLLLRLADTQHVGPEVPNMALELLATLPTYPALMQQLAAALDGADKHRQLAAVFDSSSSKLQGDQLDTGAKPYQVLYALQALCALLFPTFDEALLPLSTDAEEVMAEASACPSPAGTAAPPASAPVQPAAVLQHLQKVQHREQQQQEFLHNRGLEVALDAAQKAAQCTKCDLKLRRQLSELLVMLLHNLIDKAHAWSGQLGYANDMVSGEESGAAAIGAAGATVASSQRGGTAAMSGVQQQQQPPGEAGSSSVAGGANKDAQVAVADVQQQAPASPSMEDVVTSPPPSGDQQRKQQQQQQQSGKQQRPRAGDLPPLPPAAPANGNNAASAAAAMAQNLAVAFGSRTLKLVADTLQAIAVDTAQLWGIRVTPLVIDEEDKAALAVAEKDISVVKDAMGLLSLLLQHQPLVQQLLLDADHSPLITVVLVNPHYVALRRQAAELLEKLVAGDVQSKLLQWLLLQLSAARKVAESMPASSTEFYELLSGIVTRLGFISNNGWGAVPQQLFTVAGQILDDEVENMKAVAAAPAATASGSIEAAVAACTLLQGRLQLVLALVRTLDRRSVGSDSESGLIRLLLQDFLFPEAVQQLTAAAGRLDLADCATKLEPRCATPSCRKAALDLLSELLGDNAGSLEEGVSLLIDLHYQQQRLLGWNMIPRMLRAPGSYMGLKNGGATCYMNAVFQQLFMQPQIRAGVLSAAEVEREQASESVFAQLQAMFATMALGKATFHAPKEFWYAFKDYDGSPIDVKEHQDAYEFFTRLQDFVDQHLTSTGQPPAIKPFMGGTFVQQIICRGVDYTSEREEEFYQISVDVKGMGCLEKSLDDYVKGELMEGDNAYHVEHLGKRVAAVKRTAIKQLPQMLCIHLKRFEFDYHNQTRYKVRDRFEFPLELDMFKYSAAGLALQDQQQKAEQQQATSCGPATSSGDAGLSSSTATSTSGNALGRQLSDAVQQALAAKSKASTGAGGDAYMYDLKGVVVHSGSAFTGHYYSFIQERLVAGSSSADSEGEWYLFDDKQVTSWDVSDLESECFGGKPSQDADGRIRPTKNEYDRAHSAYMLFYERRPPSSSGEKQTAASSSKPGYESAPAAAKGDVPMAQAADFRQQGHFTVPYNMPVGLYKQVVESNIYLMWSQHVLDKDYFRFIRQLVDSKGDLGQLSNRKARRRETAAAGAAAGGPACSGSSGGRLQSSMSCDLPTAAASGSTAAAAAGTRTPMVTVGNEGPEGAVAAAAAASPSPMAVSPAPAAAAAAAAAAQPQAATDAAVPMTPAAGPSAPAAAGGAAAAAVNIPRLSPLTLSPAEPQASPGPSSRRGEEAEAVAVALLRLGVLFQFQVYLRAADSLRSEGNVWLEALMGLMGAGHSSAACLQAFLELSVLHPEWLQQFLLDSEEEVPLVPRRWAVDMITWSFETAAKRVSGALSQHVSHFILLQQYMEPGAVPGQPTAPLAGLSAQDTRVVEQIANQAQLVLSPLASAVLAFVDKVVLLVRDCVPPRRGGRDQGNQLLDPPEVPADAVRVLHKYAALGPWAAAHLMLAVQLVPDLAEIIIAYVGATDDDDYLADDIVPLYELLYELLQHTSNIPQLADELSNHKNSSSFPNPYMTSAALTASLGGSDAAAAAAQQGTGSPASLNVTTQVYNLLCHEDFMHGLLFTTCVSSQAVVKLAGLLTWNNSKLSMAVLKFVNQQIAKSLQAEQAGNSKGVWDIPRLHWSMVALQPDAFIQPRVLFWSLGTFDMQGTPRPVLPCTLYWTEAYNWQTICQLKFLAYILDSFKEQISPANYSAARQCILQVMCQQQRHVVDTLMALRDVKEELREVRELANGLLQEITLHAGVRAVQQQLQRQRSDPRQQQVATAAAAEGAVPDAGEGAADEDQAQQQRDIGQE